MRGAEGQGDGAVIAGLVARDELAPHQPQADLIGDDARRVETGLRQDDGEFLATVARRRVAAFDRVGERLGDEAQHLIADLVTVSVVEALEMIDVGDEQAQRLVVVRGLAHRLAQTHLEGFAVRNAGERVGQRLALHRLEILLKLDDFARGAIEALLEHAIALRHVLRLDDEIGDETAHFLRLALADGDLEIIEGAAEGAGVADRGTEMLAHLIDDVGEAAAGVLQQDELPGGVEEAAIKLAIDLRRDHRAAGENAIDRGLQFRQGAGMIGIPDSVILRRRRHAVGGHRNKGRLTEFLRLRQLRRTVHAWTPLQSHLN